jgi:hypothetical protein
MEKRYRALRIIGTVYKVLGVIAGVLTIIAVVGFCLATVLGGAALGNLGESSRNLGAAGALGGALSGVVVGIIGIIYGGGLALSLYGLGEGVYLAISVEENTRATVRLLEQQSRPPQNPGV